MWFIFTLVTAIRFGHAASGNIRQLYGLQGDWFGLWMEAYTSKTVYPLPIQLQNIRPLSKLTFTPSSKLPCSSSL
jgi:hypothetical protein